MLVLQVWRGDLGLDTGVPQNVYQLDTAGMTQATGADGAPATLVVPLGETVDLPDGLGTLTFDALPRYVALDLRYDPSLGWVLGFALTALLGLALSLFVPRRRVWLRVTEEGGRTLVRTAALARAEDVGLVGEVERVLDAVRELGPAEPHDGRPARSTSRTAGRRSDCPARPRTAGLLAAGTGTRRTTMNVAELSTIVVWGATTAYALAFGAFAFDLARRAEVSTSRRVRAAQPAEPALAGAATGSVADPTGGASSTTRPAEDDRAGADTAPDADEAGGDAEDAGGVAETDAADDVPAEYRRGARWGSRCR